MTNKGKDVIKNLERSEKLGVLVDTSINSLGPHREPAQKTLEDEFKTELINTFYGGNSATYDAFSDEEKKARLIEGADTVGKKLFEDARREFTRNVGDIVKSKDKKYDKSLTRLVGDFLQDKELVSYVDPKQGELLGMYASLENFDRIGKMLKNGDGVDDKTRKQILEKRVEAIVRRKMKEFSNKYTDETANALAKFYAMTARDSATDEDVKEGLKIMKEDIKEKIESKFGKDYEQKVADTIGESLVKVAESSERKLEEKATQLYFLAEKDRGYSSKNYTELFPKKKK